MITGVIFKRVGLGRPYPDHGLTSRTWADLPPRQVRLDELVTTKDTLQLATLLVAARPGAPELPTGRPVDLLDAPCLDISSRELRARAARGRSLRYLVPDAVWRYIERRGLYRAEADPSPAT